MRGSAFTATLFAMACLVARPATSETPTSIEAVRFVQIAPQALESALLAYANQCSVQLVVAAQTIAGIRSRGARGAKGCDGVPNELLAGTKLSYRLIGPATIAIVAERDVDARHVAMSRETASAVSRETVMVTGSRIRNRSSEGPLPIVSLRGEVIASTGQINLADALIELPSVEPGFGPRNSQAQTSGGAGLNLLNLRGMGVERSLVLVDGRRQVGARRGLGAVDINAIPAAFVDRVDIVTGGNSAVYGADAVTGVLNIVLKDRYEGAGVDVTGGQTSDGDGSWHSLQLFGGHEFEHFPLRVMGSFVSDQASSVEASARSYASNGLDVIANPQGSPLYIHSEEVRVSNFASQGSFDIGSQRYVFRADGSGAREFDFGPSGDLSGSHVGGDGPQLDEFITLRMPMQRKAAFARLEYDFAAAPARLALQLRGSESQVTASWQPLADPVTIGPLALRIDNPFLPADTVAMMRAAGIDELAVSRLHYEFGRAGTANRRRLVQFSAELDGDLNGGWDYEVFVSVGRNWDRTHSLNMRDTSRFLESLDAVRDVSGDIVCRDAAARARGCVPLNIVGSHRMTSDAIEYSRIDLPASERLTESVIGGHLAGPIDIGAFRLDSVFGLEYREEASERHSSVEQSQGLVSLPRVPSDHGRYDAIEAYSEFATRLVGVTPVSESLDVATATRVAQYSTTGTELAWQASLNYAMTQDVRLRLVRSRSIRAPNIRELYSRGEEGFVSISDPCDAVLRDRSMQRADNCSALGLGEDFDGENRILRRVLYSGNPQLRAETADTWTIGLVLTSAYLPRWRFSADYWRIGIDAAIETFDEQTIVDRCVDADANIDTNPYCALTLRDSAGLIQEIRAIEQNGGRLFAAGIDFDLSFGDGLQKNGSGPWLQLLATRLLRFETPEPPPYGGTRELAGVLPHLRFQLSMNAGYRFDALAIGWKSTFLSSGLVAESADALVDRARTGTRSFHDAFASYDFDELARVRLGVGNVFDATPPQRAFGISQGQGPGALYPNLGRHFFAALDVKF